MRTVELPDASLASYLAIIESQPGSYRHLFRGQGNCQWGLLPALYRGKQPNIAAETLSKSYDLYEQQCIELFFREGLPYIPPIRRSFSNDRVIAQHFGVPTRLIDWSQDPLVALFFAVEQADANIDVAVYMIAPDAQHLPEEVWSVGPHKVIAMQPPAIDRRIPAQKSIFTFHPYGPENLPFVPLDQRFDIGNTFTTGGQSIRGFVKIVILGKFAVRLRSTLFGMGIDRRNLFPGLDGVGQDINMRARLGLIF
ncbi:FRG domain-containing protein [Brucella anthropi]|uniref:FRG domain-containing protein n=1 Tax=Brucella anthropi TaxID=529 RepID=A0A6L3YYH3_BRUAN|nr:FRG domain-containing protein [Brucella anthropi]KAB2755672.1 FRG domain-containing protein [Brucella anthropi]UVV70352.1 FRG domain-containing protein [Brucella anthropi]